VAYWTLQNMGIGNVAQINVARSRLRQSDYERLEVLNAVRLEVATGYTRALTRFAQIATAERAVRASIDSFKEDMIRIHNNEGLPIEVLDSLRLLGRARFEYLNSIAEYNASQFELYVALGQPPANALARSANQPNQRNQPNQSGQERRLPNGSSDEAVPPPPPQPSGQN
jgi:outer membrane protein TolC